MTIRGTVTGALGAAAALGLSVASAAPPAPMLKVSENHRYLVTAHGEPFFWLGDTAWELFHRLNREEAARYLQNRAALRYTVVQAVALAELDGAGAPNAYGHLPLVDRDPARPVEEYFGNVDWVVARANELGIVVAMLPTWGSLWHDGTPIFNRANAEVYGEWLGRRYRNASLVWILGGDRPVETLEQLEIIRAMARGLRKGDGGAHLMTFHPPGANSSSTWLHDEPWLDFNMRQNGHVLEYTGRYQKTRADYDRQPVKPVIDGEPIYEDHPVDFNARRLGHSVSADVRRPLYWDLFAGAFGHTYGHHSVWQMAAPERPPVNNPLMPWYDAILQPGAAQMRHGRALMESRPFFTRVPADDVLVEGAVPSAMPGAGVYHFAATRDTERTYAMVYAPVGRPFTVRLEALKAARIKAWWFNPRTGKATPAGTFAARGEKRFQTPTPGELLDWVLVLDDAARGYAAPGIVRK
ncbi:MAG: glycoside hydrolase family 140 protein [Armatimonadetes bacterium]|nr:glycoside hydrolase family 140 protein [Armatimonadota bacterium]